MASRTVEILLKATDGFSDTNKKLQLQMAALKIQTDEYNKSVEKLQKQHPGLDQGEARAAAEALQQMREQTERASEGFLKAKESAHLLTEETGLHLPRALRTLLAESKVIGPALEAAFTVVAVIGFIDALREVPKVYDEIIGKLTGWDEKSQETYAHIVEDNRKLLKQYDDFQSRLVAIQKGAVAGAEDASKRAGVRAKDDLKAASGAAQELAAGIAALTTGLAITMPGIGGLIGPTIGRYALGGDQSDKLKAQADESGNEAREAQRKVIEAQAEAAKQRAEDQKAYNDFFEKQVLAFRNQTFGNDNTAAAMRSEAVTTMQANTHKAVEAMIKDYESLMKAEQDAGDALIEYGKYWEKQAEDFRIHAGSEAVNKALEPNDTAAKKIIEAFKKAQEEHKKLVATFQETIGSLWDSFFLKGKGVLGDLANLAKDLVQGITRNIVEGLATNLAFGKSGSGGLLGGIIGAVSKHASAGPMSEAIPGGGGLASSGGLLGALGGLFKKTAPDFVGPIAPATGITGALGLGGGAGLLGLGAATLPVLGGLTAAAALIAEQIFGRHHDAPFTRDPNAIQNTREYLFYSGVQDFAAASKDMLDFTHNLNTLPTGALVKSGLPVALASSNQFRRDVSAVLNQDL